MGERHTQDTSNAPAWARPPAQLALPGEAVHVWRASLDQPAGHVQRLAQTLSAGEQDRAARFRFERDRRRFIVAQGLLRTILGRYLAMPAGRLQFEYGPYGKPFLDADVHFNLAHSHELALYAITQAGAIGIDLEHVRPIAEAGCIVEQFFSEREKAAFRALSPERQQEAFFNMWTCKEAYLKAVGRGLHQPLDSVEVWLTPEAPPQLMQWEENGQSGGWFIQALRPAAGYVAAIAIRSPGGTGQRQFNYLECSV